jgi:ring-1,2-phenylacetyl-CoA epoxidase subunit PaaB
MNIQSLDPRMNRLSLQTTGDSFEQPVELDQWQTWQVFHQESRGAHHKHVGIVHAPTPEMALLMAKEQYARRFQCVNLWVVRTTDVYATDYDDADMFEPATSKLYREMQGYKDTSKVLTAWQKAQGAAVSSEVDDSLDDVAKAHSVLGFEPASSAPEPRAPEPPADHPPKKGKIIIGRKPTA